MKILELFSGYGSQALALRNLGVDFVSEISEIDKYAIQAYTQLHGKTKNYGDITQIERLDYADLWTYSSPCQDFSTAGKQKGIYNADGSLTRSGLLKHVERLLTDSVLFGTQPKYLLMENVKGLVSKKFKPDFDRWLAKLETLGYNNYWQVLNAKDYGIPQNRERVFVVSIRKDIDTKGYKFPSPVPLQKRLKDMLEPCVDEKYYLSADKVEKLTTQIKEKEISNTIRCGGGLEPKILEENIKNYRIRKLTARECFRLMGVKDEQFDRLHGISNSQLYKLAGNSIVVNVLEAIFRNLFMEKILKKKNS